MKGLRVGGYKLWNKEGGRPCSIKLWKQKSSKERAYVFNLIVRARLESAGKQGVSFG